MTIALAELVATPLVAILKTTSGALVADQTLDMIGLRKNEAGDVAVLWQRPRDRQHDPAPTWTDWSGEAARLLTLADTFVAEELTALKSGDVHQFNAFRNRYSLGGPRLGMPRNQDGQVELLMHMERVKHPGLTEEERAASAKWIKDRTERGRG